MKLTEIKPNPNNPRKFNCLKCGDVFTSKKFCKNRIPKFCSKTCYGENLKKWKECKQCKKQFADYKKKVFCSIDCRHKSRRGIRLSKKWRTALSEGRIKSEKCKGKNLYNWKGGKATEQLRVKASFYKRKKALKKDFDRQFLFRILVAQQNKCFYCESHLEKYKAIEHLTPVTRGGDNDNFNLVYSCKSCNSEKHQNTLEEFAIQKSRFDWLEKFDEIYATAIY